MPGKADTRIFRITREFAGCPRYASYPAKRPGRVEYGDRRVASAKCGSGGYSHQYGPVVRVEATNAEATEGWTDVTSDFISS